ncbi:hypothetical protein CEXT_535131 [Caerostris extrusa]|uniref:Uncharacterized protein n=1 Tax=Caerostris extrusa TaxID=172846 RepID=A0AAV4RG15_CAEEX|nr:hypothetical protein CEXT_535131 [Caerostris extrusa]
MQGNQDKKEKQGNQEMLKRYSINPKVGRVSRKLTFFLVSSRWETEEIPPSYLLSLTTVAVNVEQKNNLVSPHSKGPNAKWKGGIAHAESSSANGQFKILRFKCRLPWKREGKLTMLIAAK